MLVKSYFAIRHFDTIGAFLELSDNQKNQIVIRFIPYKDEHVTIHETNGGFLKTHWMPNKPSSTWDKWRVESAAKNNFKDPSKHSKYVVNSPFNQEGLFNYGEHLISRRFRLDELSAKDSYVKNAQVIELNRDTAFMGFYFSQDKLNTDQFMFEVKTSLGYIYVVDGKK